MDKLNKALLVVAFLLPLTFVILALCEMYEQMDHISILMWVAIATIGLVCLALFVSAILDWLFEVIYSQE